MLDLVRRVNHYFIGEDTSVVNQRLKLVVPCVMLYASMVLCFFDYGFTEGGSTYAFEAYFKRLLVRETIALLLIIIGSYLDEDDPFYLITIFVGTYTFYQLVRPFHLYTGDVFYMAAGKYSVRHILVCLIYYGLQSYLVCRNAILNPAHPSYRLAIVHTSVIILRALIQLYGGWTLTSIPVLTTNYDFIALAYLFY